MNTILHLTLDQLDSLQLQRYHGTNKPATLLLPDLRPVDLCVCSRAKGDPCALCMRRRPKRKPVKVLVQFPKIIEEQIRNECTCWKSWGWSGRRRIKKKCCFRTKKYIRTHKEKAIQTDNFYQEDETTNLMLLTNLALSGLPGGLWNWRPGEPNKLENWRT